MYDPELPGGFQDADFETRELVEAGNHAARLRRKGVCLHNWLHAPFGGPCKCNDCGKVWPTEAECEEERRELLI